MKRILSLLIATMIILPLLAVTCAGAGSCCFSVSSEAEDGENSAVSDETYLVRFLPSVEESRLHSIVSAYSGTLLSDSEDRIYLLNIPEENEFRNCYGNEIVYCSKNEIRTAAAVPEDPYFRDSDSFEECGIYEAMEEVSVSSDIIIAVLDTGVNRTHPDLNPDAILEGYDVIERHAGVTADSTGHGTAVIGILAATAGNGIGTAGIAGGAKILPVRISSGENIIYSSDLVMGIRYAVDYGAKIINLSLGGYTYSAAENDAVQYALENGCILIASAGNDGIGSHGDDYFYPASYDGVISVGSCNENGEISSFSQKNDRVDLLAPGENVYSLGFDEEGNGTYIRCSGSSFSSAVMSGVAALVLSAMDEGIRCGSEEFLALLGFNAERSETSGYGMLQAEELISYANAPLITGVVDGGVYESKISVSFNRGTATLDGEEFLDGDTVYQNGNHTLVVSDGIYQKTISFRLVYEPSTYQRKSSGYGFYYEFTSGKAYLDGIPYTYGELVTSPGWHHFELIDDYGDSLEEDYFLEEKLGIVSGISDGGVYHTPVRICVSGADSVLLDGETLGRESIVDTDGEHILIVSSSEGTKTYSFTIETGAEQILSMEHPQEIVVSSHNWYAVYEKGTGTVSLYSFEGEAAEQTVSVGTIQSVSTLGNHLLVLAEGELRILDAEKLFTEEQNAIVSVIPCEDFAVCMNQIYYLSDGMIFQWNGENQESEKIKATEASGLYASENRLWEVNDTTGWISCVLGGEYSLISPVSLTIESDCMFSDDCYFVGGKCFSLQDGSIRFTYRGNALVCDHQNLFTTYGVYGVEDGLLKGNYQETVSDLWMTTDGTYVSWENGTIWYYPGEEIYAEVCTDYLTTGNPVSEYQAAFWYLGDFQVSDLGSYGNLTYLVSEESRVLLSLRNYQLETALQLPFSPEKISVGNFGICAWSSEEQVVFVENTLLFVPFTFENVVYVDDCLYFQRNSSLWKYENGEFSDTGISCDCIGGQNGLLLWRSGDWLYVRSGEVTARSMAGNGTLLTDGTYVLSGSSVFYFTGTSLKMMGSLEETPVTLSGHIVMTEQGLVDLQTGTALPSFLHFTSLGTMSSLTGMTVVLSNGILRSDYDRSKGSFGLAWEPLYVEGCEDGALYDVQTYLAYSEGTGYLDGVPVKSGTYITEPGEHEFRLLQPCGMVSSYHFTIIPAVESISFVNPVYRISVNETGLLRVSYHPTNTSSIPVTFSTESDCIALNADGSFIGLEEGTGWVTARAKNGELFAVCKVIVTAALLRFDDVSGYTVDRANGWLLGVEDDTKAEDVLAHVTSEGEVTASTKIIGTGTVITLYSARGEELDSLTAVISGDLDGDGYVTLRDFLILQSYADDLEQMGALQSQASDLDQNGTVTEKDMNLFHEMLLFRKGETHRSQPKRVKTGAMELFVSSSVFAGDEMMVLVSLSDSEEILGASGRINYDRQYLTFLQAEVLGWETEFYDSGSWVSFVSSGTAGNENVPLLLLKFRVSEEAVGQSLSFLLRDAVLVSEKSAGSCVRTEEIRTVEERTYGPLSIAIEGMTPSFRPDISDYQVVLPYGTPALDYILTYPEGTTVDIQSTAFGFSDELDAVFTFYLEDGSTSIYRIHAVRSSERPLSNDSTLQTLTIEGIPFAFSPEITEYTFTIPDDLLEIVLEFETTDGRAKAFCSSTKLEKGKDGMVTILVSAEDGSQTEYRLIFLRETGPVEESSEEEKPETVSGTYIVAIILGLVILMGVVLLVFLRKKKPSNRTAGETNQKTGTDTDEKGEQNHGNDGVD